MHGTIDGFMELISPDGTGLAYADDSLFDDYVEQPMIHSYTLPSDGTYTVVVCGYGQDEYGDYRLSTFVYGDIATAPTIEVTIPPDESGFIIIDGKRVDLTNEETIESYGLRFAYPDDWSFEVFSNTLVQRIGVQFPGFDAHTPDVETRHDNSPETCDFAHDFRVSDVCEGGGWGYYRLYSIKQTSNQSAAIFTENESYATHVK